MSNTFPRDLQYAKFSAYGFLKNLRFFEPFMILFLLGQGLSYLQVGTLYAVREIMVNVMEIPSGAVADGLGRRRTMVVSFLGYLVSFALFWFGSSMPLFLAAIVLFSVGEAFRTGTHKAMIFAYLRINNLQQHGNDYYGHTRSWSQIGSAVSAIIAAAIVFISQNYRAVFLFSMIPYLLDLILMLTYPRALDGPTQRISLYSIRENFRNIGRGLIETAKRPAAARAVLSASSFGGFYKGGKDYLQPMISALAVSLPIAHSLSPQRREALLIGAAYTLIYLLTSLASRKSAVVAGRFPNPESALNRLLIIGLGLGLLAGAARWQSLTLLPVILFLAIYALQNLRQPVGVAVVADRIPEEVLATVLSAQSQLQSLFAAIVALFVGATADLIGGNVGLGLTLSAGLGLLLLPLLRIVPRADAPRPTS
ncbi:MAG: MFS transporter [Spirochaetes bacterium]|jgi:MFS family permease|nr:MFS transporter [Spirochaetota bacterium]